jgi:hypothetical protein
MLLLPPRNDLAGSVLFSPKNGAYDTNSLQGDLSPSYKQRTELFPLPRYPLWNEEKDRLYASHPNRAELKTFTAWQVAKQTPLCCSSEEETKDAETTS